MKIVINSCYGGFGLSHEAIMKYAELSGFELYPFVDESSIAGRDFSLETKERFIPYDGQKAFLIHYSTKPLTEDGKYEEDSYWCIQGIGRDDPLLVRVVEELKAKANGNHAKLKIVKIPDGIEYEIDEYDGIESIHEVHKSWS